MARRLTVQRLIEKLLLMPMDAAVVHPGHAGDVFLETVHLDDENEDERSPVVVVLTNRSYRSFKQCRHRRADGQPCVLARSHIGLHMFA